MKREIKFRAWDTVYKNMNHEHFVIYPNGKVEYPESGWDLQGYFDKTSILMQYTGLRDKHGVEIYEGDIVQHEFEGEYGPYEHRDTVDYYGCAFYPVCEKPGSEFKVIGNIYQNPELL